MGQHQTTLEQKPPSASSRASRLSVLKISRQTIKPFLFIDEIIRLNIALKQPIDLKEIITEHEGPDDGASRFRFWRHLLTSKMKDVSNDGSNTASNELENIPKIFER